jgi:hypothetical protein
MALQTETRAPIPLWETLAEKRRRDVLAQLAALALRMVQQEAVEGGSGDELRHHVNASGTLRSSVRAPSVGRVLREGESTGRQ